MNKKTYFLTLLCILSIQILPLTASQSTSSNRETSQRLTLAMSPAAFANTINRLSHLSDPEGQWSAAVLWQSYCCKPNPAESSQSAPPPLNQHPLFTSPVIRKQLERTQTGHVETLRALLLFYYHQQQELQRLNQQREAQQQQLAQLEERLQDPCGVRTQKAPSLPKKRRGSAYKRLT